MIKKTLFFLTLTGISLVCAKPHSAEDLINISPIIINISPTIGSCTIQEHDGSNFDYKNIAFFTTWTEVRLDRVEGGTVKNYNGLLYSCPVTFDFTGAWSHKPIGTVKTTLTLPVKSKNGMPRIVTRKYPDGLPASAELVFDESNKKNK